MRLEAATIMVLEIGSFFVLFLMLPFFYTLSRVRRVWAVNRGTGILLGGVILTTAFFFAVFFGGLAVLLFGGTTGR